MKTMVIISVLALLVIVGCGQNQQPPENLKDEDLQIVSLTWNDHIIWNEACENCKKFGDCQSLNAAIVTTINNYQNNLACDFIVDGEKTNPDGTFMELEVGSDENNVKMSYTEDHSFTACCVRDNNRICKATSISAKCR